ncbi:hypothetical protein BDN72DRAFT_865222 [Pluteus cervinus]|uniref:Uncharacterized protein n=1 Tax=Pluteus cervinus TaxID=181527 RepID=A0ACD3A0Z9_9AGAR|nr:hypothetical protein BDN72DRAFT_865222 [Pluteus cervinus]
MSTSKSKKSKLPGKNRKTNPGTPYPEPQLSEAVEDPGLSTPGPSRRRPRPPPPDFTLQLSGPLLSPRLSVASFPSVLPSDDTELLPLHPMPVSFPPMFNFGPDSDVLTQNASLNRWAETVTGRDDTQALVEQTLPSFLDGMSTLLSEIKELRSKKEHYNTENENVEGEIKCSICHEPLTEPVTTECGHTHCARCLLKWLSNQAENHIRSTVGASKAVNTLLSLLPFESLDQFLRFRQTFIRDYGRRAGDKLTDYECDICHSKISAKPRFHRVFDSVVAAYSKTPPTPQNARPTDRFIPFFPA